MKVKAGDEIYFRLLPDMHPYIASVVEFDDNSLTIKPLKDISSAIVRADYVILTLNDNDFYAEVSNYNGSSLKVNLLWTEKREYFRIDDYIQIAAKKIIDIGVCRRSRIFAGYGIKTSDDLVPDQSINPVLWKMLVDIQTKLSLILERLNPETESLLNIESKHVNLSAAGICFDINEKVSKGDLLEIKMLLPSYPPVGIITYGRVVRAIDTGCGQYKIAVSFKDIEDEVKDEIIQYTLNRQRDIIRNQRKNRGHNV